MANASKSVLIYPEADELRFIESMNRRQGIRGNYIESTAELSDEPRDYLKITIINSENSSYSNYVNRGNISSVLQSSADSILNSSGTIYLYMPQQLSESYQQSYNTESIGMMGAGILNMMGSRSDMGSMAEELKDAAKGLKPEVAINAMSGAISGINQLVGTDSSLSSKGVTQLTKGAILNPYKELIYQGTEFRSHSFSFKMIARSFSEAETINSIISTLRYAMHPGIAGVGADEQFDDSLSSQFNSGQGLGKVSSDRWLTLPDFFKLDLVRINTGGASPTASLKKLIQLPTFTVLEGMSINYTPDGSYSPIKSLNTTESFGDYGVVAVQMDLTFRETAMLTRANFTEKGKYEKKPLASQNTAK